MRNLNLKYGAQVEMLMNRIDTAVYLLQKIFGCNRKKKSTFLYITGTMSNRSKGTPQPEMIQKPADFFPGEMELTPSGQSASAS